MRAHPIVDVGLEVNSKMSSKAAKLQRYKEMYFCDFAPACLSESSKAGRPLRETILPHSGVFERGSI
jgi:hypothetical protein